MNKSRMIDLLKSDVREWNKWREENPDVGVDLSGADFFRADLRRANFSNVNLTEADFTEAILRRADFSNATITDADFERSSLKNADFKNTGVSYMFEDYYDYVVHGRVPRLRNFDGSDFWLAKIEIIKFREPHHANWYWTDDNTDYENQGYWGEYITVFDMPKFKNKDTKR